MQRVERAGLEIVASPEGHVVKWFGSQVRVTLINGATGEAFGVTRKRARDLPETFERPTTMHFEGEDWQVVRAEPSTRAQFSKSRALTLHLCRVLEVDPKAIHYSHPTICDAIPGLSETPVDGSEFRLEEDDWRQRELVSNTWQTGVEREFVRIRKVRTLGDPERGWPQIRVRREPRWPITGHFTLDMLQQRMGIETEPRPLAYAGVPLRIEQGFAWTLPGWTLYGIVPEGRIQTLGLSLDPGHRPHPETAERLADLARGWTLDGVDWLACSRIAGASPEFPGFWGP